MYWRHRMNDGFHRLIREFLTLDNLLVLPNYLIPWSIFYSLLLEWCLDTEWCSSEASCLLSCRALTIRWSCLALSIYIVHLGNIYVLNHCIGQRKQSHARAGLAHLIFPKDRVLLVHMLLFLYLFHSKARNYRKSSRFLLLLRLRGCKTSCCWCQYVTVTQILPLFIQTVAYLVELKSR